MLAIYDGFNKMAEAGRASKSGLSDERVAARHVQGGLSILSGSLGLMSLFIAGGPLAFAALLVSIVVLILAWMFVELVAKAVYMWVDLSLIGNHKGQIEPFRSAEEELASLDLVFKGLTVDIQWEDVHIRISQSGEQIVESPRNNPVSGWKAANGKRFKIKVSVPDVGGMILRLDLSSGQIARSRSLFSKEYIKNDPDGKLRSVERVEDEGGVQDSVEEDEGFYIVGLDAFYSNDRLLEMASLRVSFTDVKRGGERASNRFFMRW